ncbi:ketose-bisphosphate aldolase [Iocasia frigidifontis]|uniref:Ketose-bisphosphate aldolase n=1 Tax=Iocasia fonsfrigidae TaxID=2682810 RepID=A0A8A7KJY8_9FIRM|nr:class II fructose-bisphosphate aldolase [Iocasia fonsfrigidae]QTL98182.1 ketose-bisphosphate aldolase [Iocasia fonsfrigidae]
MLVSLKEILARSIEEKYAVGAFNVTNHQMVEAIIEAAESTDVPVIINIAEVHFKYLDLKKFLPYLKNRIEASFVPIALHLDHGLSFETVIKAIRLGFSSVMIDASSLPFEENVALTAKVVEAAHAAGISVEAELGHVAGGEGNLDGGTEVNRDTFTHPEEAKKYVAKTGIDALAVAIGTVHGPYKGQPELDFDLLVKLRKEVDIPLVLHGGSGLNDSDFRKAIELGINKVNFYTQNSIQAVEAIYRQIRDTKGKIGFPELTLTAQSEILKQTKKQIELFGTKSLNIKNK